MSTAHKFWHYLLIFNACIGYFDPFYWTPFAKTSQACTSLFAKTSSWTIRDLVPQCPYWTFFYLTKRRWIVWTLTFVSFLPHCTFSFLDFHSSLWENSHKHMLPLLFIAYVIFLINDICLICIEPCFFHYPSNQSFPSLTYQSQPFCFQSVDHQSLLWFQCHFNFGVQS